MSQHYDLSLLQKLARSELFPLLHSTHGLKSLAIDDNLMKPLDRLISNSILRQMEFVKIYKFSNVENWTRDDSDLGCHRFYLVRPRSSNVQKIVNHRNANKSLEMTVIFWPRKLQTCLNLIEQNGLFGEIKVEEFNPSFVCLSRDLISLELPEFFASTFLHETQAWCHTVATSILKLSLLYGSFHAVHCFGPCALKIFNLTQRINAQREKSAPDDLEVQKNAPAVELFLVDRSLDFVPIFLSGLTYDSLLDEIFGIKCGFVDFGTELSKHDEKNQKPLKILLNENDRIHELVKDVHFSHVFDEFKKEGEKLKQKMDKRHGLDKIDEMKSFVAKDLQALRSEQKSLAVHVTASEILLKKKQKLNFSGQLHVEAKIIRNEDSKHCLDFIENLMCQQSPKILPLSLMCLYSLTNNGLTRKDFLSLRRQFLHAYGHKFLYLFAILQKSGILREKEGIFGSQNKFLDLCKRLNLLPDQPASIKTPADPSFVYNGVYSPLLCRLIWLTLQNNGLSSAPIFDELKSSVGSQFAFFTDSFDGRLLIEDDVTKKCEKRGVKLIFFLGGVTYPEIAALRLINRVYFPKCHFIVAATDIINKDRLVQSVMDDFCTF